MASLVLGVLAKWWQSGSLKENPASTCGIWIFAASARIHPVAVTSLRVPLKYIALTTISVIQHKSAAVRVNCVLAQSITGWRIWARYSARKPAGNAPTGSQQTKSWQQVRIGRHPTVGPAAIGHRPSEPNIKL